MNSNEIRDLCEAYVAVYDEDLRSQINYDFDNEDLSFIDDLSDNELDQIMESIFLDGEIGIDECFESFDYILSEATVTSSDHREVRSSSARVTSSAERPSRVARSAERQKKVRIGRLTQAAQRTGEKLASSARSTGTSVSSRVGQASQKVKSAAQKVKRFLGKVGRAAKAGAVAAKKEFSGEAGKEAQAKYRDKKEARAKEAKASVGNAFAKSPKPSDPWKGSATKPKSSSKVTTKSTKALSGSSSRPALSAGRDSDRVTAAKAKLAKAAAGSTTKGIRFAGRTSGQVAPQRAHTGVKSALEKFRKKAGISEEFLNSILDYIFEDLINEGYAYNYDHAFDILESLSFDLVTDLIESYLPESEEVETVDLYDVVMDYLLDEGYAETEESAEVIMVNMSEEWRDEILEATYSA